MKRIMLATAILAATSLPAAAQYMPPQVGGWNSSTFGNQTFHYGTGALGGWSGNTMRFGDQSFSTLNGPNGQSQRCNSMRFGAQVFTNCN